MHIEYDGSAFHGWQVQPDRPTVQEAIEQALATALRVRPDVVGSGRTDAGVHARGQVAHFRTDVRLEPFRLLGSLGGLLPKTIAVHTLEEVRPDFHARFDARRRRYHYHASLYPRALERNWRLHLRPAPDFERMNQAARVLLGQHDFDAFCRTASATRNRVCTIEEAGWVADGRPGDWRFEIVADRFLHGMVRAIVGTLLEVGRGRRPAEDLARVLASRDRREAGPAAPAHGLVLERVEYEIR